PARIALALLSVGNVALEQREYTRARTLYEESLAVETTGDARIRARVLNNLGVLAQIQGDFARALAIYEQCRQMWRDLGDTWSVATILVNIGDAASALGEGERAGDCYRQSLIMRRDLGDRDGVRWTLQSMGYLAHRQGEDERAARVLAAAAVLAVQLGSNLAVYEQGHHDQNIEQIRDSLGEPAFATNWAQGQAMTHEQAIAYALSTGDQVR
ncbi:MAG TPA: tetratricopeptide repeat protein, partial [Chloroflexota bacterium]|nr:tetratricopeptide repeat protein [Chloroflexota bacterium]